MMQAVEMAVANVKSGNGGPFAALVVKDGEIVGRGTNRVTSSNDPTSHAEINAIREGCAALGDYQLKGCDIYTTCEPCPMCMGAIYWARADKVYYAATREHAQSVGFDDEFIYRQLSLGPEERSIEMMQIAQTAATRPFDVWKSFEDRVEY